MPATNGVFVLSGSNVLPVVESIGVTGPAGVFSFDTNLLPTSNNTISIGSTAAFIDTIYANNVYAKKSVFAGLNTLHFVQWNDVTQQFETGPSPNTIGVSPSGTSILINGVNPGTIHIKGALGSTGALLLITDAVVGDAYMVDSHLWVANTDNPQNISGWTNVGDIKGPQGNQGYEGPQGIQGFTGSTGYTGTQGLTGPQGIQGFTGSTGYTGTQGLTGPQGIQGFTGEVGPKGADGNASGTGTFVFSGDTGAILFYDGATVTGTSGFIYNQSGSPKLLSNIALRLVSSLILDSILSDSTNSSGMVGQVLSSTRTGTQWIDAPTGPTGTRGSTFFYGSSFEDMTGVNNYEAVVGDMFINNIDGTLYVKNG